MSARELCCEHLDSEHAQVGVCEDVVHYPDEDALCLCEGFTSGQGGRCESCRHLSEFHKRIVLCRPASSSHCSCARPLQDRAHF